MADCYEELSEKQFIQLAELKFNGGDQLTCEVKAFRILTGMSRFRFKIADSEMITRSLPHLQWVFDDKATSKQLLPVFNGYHGPVSEFDNLKMKEFHFSEQYYKDLVYEEKDEAIDKLIAVLYRQGKPGYDTDRDPDGDIRMAFNANLIAYNANKIAKWPDSIKHAIFLWYYNCRQELIDNNPMVFKEPSNGFESQFETGLYGMIRNLAGDKLGSVAAIEEMYVHTAMLELGILREEEKYFDEQSKIGT